MTGRRACRTCGTNFTTISPQERVCEDCKHFLRPNGMIIRQDDGRRDPASLGPEHSADLTAAGLAAYGDVREARLRLEDASELRGSGSALDRFGGELLSLAGRSRNRYGDSW